MGSERNHSVILKWKATAAQKPASPLPLFTEQRCNSKILQVKIPPYFLNKGSGLKCSDCQSTTSVQKSLLFKRLVKTGLEQRRETTEGPSGGEVLDTTRGNCPRSRGDTRAGSSLTPFLLLCREVRRGCILHTDTDWLG